MDNVKSVKEAIKIIQGLKKKLLEYDTKVTEAGHGYVMGDHLTRLINASVVHELDVILEEIEIIESATGIKFE